MDEVGGIRLRRAAEQVSSCPPTPSGCRPAFEVIEPTLQLVRWAQERGVKVHSISGRRDTAAEQSTRNLRKHGYPVHADRLTCATATPRNT